MIGSAVFTTIGQCYRFLKEDIDEICSRQKTESVKPRVKRRGSNQPTRPHTVQDMWNRMHAVFFGVTDRHVLKH